MAGHVLVIGVDGVRFDLLGPDTTPCIWGLGQAGFLAPVPIDDATPTWSGPCWATIATGAAVTEHGITGNDLAGHRLAEHPDFVTTATRAGLATLLAVSGWAPLARPEDGGPLFAEAGRREFVEVTETSVPVRDAADDAVTDLAAAVAAWHAADDAVTEQAAAIAAWDAADDAVTDLAAAILERDAPRLSFVYLGAVDIAGHLTGAGAVYRAAGQAADQRVGRLLAAVGSRPDPQNWTTVVVTDHGHLDRGGHGGREPEVTTAWAAAAGPGIRPGAPPLITRQAQVAPLVLAALGP